MVVQYTTCMCDVDIHYPVTLMFPGLFIYAMNEQELLRDLVPGLPYPVLFTRLVLFPYPVKSSILKYSYMF